MNKQQLEIFEEVPMVRLVFIMSVAMILSSTAQNIYNIVDRIFIAHYVDPTAIAAIHVGYPILLSIIAFAALFAIGGSILYSQALGAKDFRRAELVKFTCLSSSLLGSLILIPFILAFLREILTFLGANPKTLPYAMKYYHIFVLFMPLVVSNAVLGLYLRSEGKPKLPTIAIIAASLVNIALDWLFMGAFGWGVSGAVWATIISQLASLGILGYSQITNSPMPLRLRKFLRFDLETLRSIMSNGSAYFLTMLVTAATVFAFNYFIYLYHRKLSELAGIQVDMHLITSDLAIASMIATIRILMLELALAFANGIQPIVSYNMGAKRPERIRHAYKMALLYASLFIVLPWLLIEIFPAGLIQLFNLNTNFFQASTALRITFAVMLGNVYTLISTTMIQALGMYRLARLMALFRLIPIALPFPLIYYLILPNFWLIYAIQDGLLFALTGVAMLSAYRRKLAILTREAQEVIP